MVYNVIRKIQYVIIYIYNRIFGNHTKTSLQEESAPLQQFNYETTKRLPIKSVAQHYGGKLLLKKEFFLPSDLFDQLVKNKYLLAIDSIRYEGSQKICVRCNNRISYLFGTLPCAVCKRDHYYCRNCLEMGAIMDCEPLYFWNGPTYNWKKHDCNVLTWQGTLTPVQQIGANKIKQAILQKTRLLVWAVTGSGKTEMLFAGLTYALQRGDRICIATPRSDVVRELFPRIQQAFKNVSVQSLHGKSRNKETTAQLIITTTHQLLRFKRAFDTLIIDEIDSFPFHKDPTLQFATMRAAKKKAANIYLTATPRKEMRRKIFLRQLPHFFVPLRYHAHPLPEPRLIKDITLNKSLANKDLPKALLRWFQSRKKRHRQVLIFVPTIALSSQLVPMIYKALNQLNIIHNEYKIDYVHSEDLKREQKITSFRKKSIHILITTTILERGVTFPSIDVVVLQACHEVFDEAALVQIAGRAGRNKNDPTGDVLFIYQHKTKAIVQAIHAIKHMNNKGEKLLRTIQKKGE